MRKKTKVELAMLKKRLNSKKFVKIIQDDRVISGIFYSKDDNVLIIPQQKSLDNSNKKVIKNNKGE